MPENTYQSAAGTKPGSQKNAYDVKLLEAEMRNQGFEKGKFLIDGFPRNF